MHSPLLPYAQMSCCRMTSLTAGGVGVFTPTSCAIAYISPLMAATSVPPLDHVRVSTRWQIFI
ncbi:MAG: hypothetical protein E7053_00685 [Lentisphaerae bacterium]|nr:hypothetical protein [Lentisphaerota bacterium]